MFEFTLACMGNGNYVCPPDAGPRWHELYEAGYDMEEFEATLRLTPEQRLEKHDKKLNELLEFEAFLEKLQRGLNCIKSHHVYPR